MIEEHLEFEERPENIIIVKSTLRNPHPLVHHAKVQLKNPYTDHYKRCSGRGNCLSISVGKNSIQRALLILDALIRALEKRGFQTHVGKEYGETTRVLINGEEISFSIQESSKRILNPSPKYEGRLSYLDNVYEYVPTGKLTLRINEYYQGEKSVSDG